MAPALAPVPASQQLLRLSQGFGHHAPRPLVGAKRANLCL